MESVVVDYIGKYSTTNGKLSDGNGMTTQRDSASLWGLDWYN